MLLSGSRNSPVRAAEEAAHGAPSSVAWLHPARAWFAVAALLMAYTSSFIDRQIVNLLVEPIRHSLAITNTEFSLLGGIAFSLFYATMGIPLARLADRGSRRLVIFCGVTVWSVMTAACGLASSFAGLFIARMGVGMGEAALSPAAYSMIADSFPPERRARALAVYSTGPYLGAGLAMLVGGQVIDAVAQAGPRRVPLAGLLEPWQQTFLLVGLPGLLIAALFLVVREPLRHGVRGGGQRAGALAFMWQRRTTFVPLILGFSIFGIAGVCYLAWMPAVLFRLHGWSPAQVGQAYGLILLAGAVPGVLAGGWICDRITARGRSDSPLLTTAIALAGCLPFAVATPLIADTGWLLASLAGFSLFGGLLNSMPATALQLILSNELRAQVTAIYFLVGNLISLALGPTIVALLSDHVLGGPRHIGGALAIVAGVSVGLAALLLVRALPAYRASAAEARVWQGYAA